jgi:hypothetical protein
MRFIPAVAALALVGGLVAVAPPAGAAGPAESFAVSPKSPVVALATVTVWEDDGGCDGTVKVTIGDGPGDPVSAWATTDVQGGWTVDLQAPGVTGSYTVSAVCHPSDKKDFDVPPFTSEALDIVALPQMNIDPPSGPAGTMIGVSGTECSFTGVSISLVSDPDGVATVLDSVNLLPETSDWMGHLTVPVGTIATADGGNYVVEATCGGSVEFTFNYTSVPFVVTAAVVPTTTSTTMVAPTTTTPPAVKATAVAAAAAFTG